ncbi:hypothetical protein R3W88_027173 [Solanum pinnatisectum]|uniref:Uncharacterized protein n=1 Tax=Solanum pinnatisectum TaxID=50273 RepID=A0AAV9LGD7_9SOLN|nr:hypothetical protein R3W88_027173 [Solanum pinnatisectum]
MSGLVDMWTNEIAKLKNKKDQNQVVDAHPIFTRKANSEPFSLFQIYGGLPLNKLLNYSEAAVSMIVDCVSP